MNRAFEKITDKMREEIEKELQLAVVEQFRQEELEKDFYKYEVQLNELAFITCMSDEELYRQCAYFLFRAVMRMHSNEK